MEIEKERFKERLQIKLKSLKNNEFIDFGEKEKETFIN